MHNKASSAEGILAGRKAALEYVAASSTPSPCRAGCSENLSEEYVSGT